MRKSIGILSLLKHDFLPYLSSSTVVSSKVEKFFSRNKEVKVLIETKTSLYITEENAGGIIIRKVLVKEKHFPSGVAPGEVFSGNEICFVESGGIELSYLDRPPSLRTSTIQKIWAGRAAEKRLTELANEMLGRPLTDHEVKELLDVSSSVSIEKRR